MDATRRNVGPCKRAALALLIVLTFVAVGIAQDKPATTTAVSNTAAPSLNENPQTKAASEVAPKDKVLTKSSIFFPDLASNREPLTVGGKFNLFVKNGISPAAFLGSAFGAGIAQATNSPSGYGQGAEGYGKRFGSSMATGASANFFSTFVLASISREDPRFFVHGRGTFGKRFKHAVTRVVVAPEDRGGYGFNWGAVFGPLCAETLANTYLPVREQTGARTMERYGGDVGTTVGVNVLKEFWPDIFRHFGLKK
jgi:hypothetical protein